ncbi:hypothetical protein Naga_100027g17 [Nannochloropsis gaditana]|uniref:Uncharacterized protein n=1 Tax=Nannochloropsis gaditana TaxID=72520 RepID=W7TAE6_9STRA|nr:hypothetical protein Naga_100027g17 [Nannochloropsis gaditana]
MCQSGRLLEVLRSALCFRDSGSHIRRYVVHHAVQQYVEEQQAQQEQLLEPGSISQAGAEDMETEGMRGAKRAALQAYESRAEDDEDELYVLKGTFSLAKCLALPPGKFIRRCTRGPSIDIFANAKQPWGYRDVLSKEWGEVVRESSPHFDRRAYIPTLNIDTESTDGRASLGRGLYRWGHPCSSMTKARWGYERPRPMCGMRAEEEGTTGELYGDSHTKKW